MDIAFMAKMWKKYANIYTQIHTFYSLHDINCTCTVLVPIYIFATSRLLVNEAINKRKKIYILKM